MKGAQVFHKMITAREPDVAFAYTVMDWTVHRHGIVHARFVTFDISQAGEQFTAFFTVERTTRSARSHRVS